MVTSGVLAEERLCVSNKKKKGNTKAGGRMENQSILSIL
jgi:hypothetical protein